MTATVPMLPDMPKPRNLSPSPSVPILGYITEDLRAYALEALRRRSVVDEGMVVAFCNVYFGPGTYVTPPLKRAVTDALTAALEAQK